MMKKALLVFGLSLAAAFILGAKPASADTYNGYFSGGPTISGDHYWCNILGTLINPGPCVNSDGSANTNYAMPGFGGDSNTLKAQLKGFIADKLNGGGRERVGASFIIDTSIGQNNGKDLNPGSPAFAEWVTRLDNPQLTIRIDNVGYDINSAYDEQTDDELFYGESGLADALVFRLNGAIVYVLKLDCGNPLGNYTLPNYTPPPPVVATCTSSSFPTSMPVGQQQSFVARVDLSADWGPPYSVNPSNPALNSPVFHVRVLNPGDTPIFDSDVGYGAPPAGMTMTSDPVTFTPNTPGLYKVQWTFIGQGLNIECGWNEPGGGGLSTGTAAYVPFFSVLGGDVAAGPGFGASCTPDPNAGITGRNLGTSSGYYGAGSQLGALASGTVNNFASALGGIAGGAAPPTGLTFANTTSNVAGDGTGIYGGGFARPTWCVPDYVSKAQANPASGTLTTPLNQARLNSLANGTYTVSGDLTLSSLQLAQGQKITVVVTGDVYITGDITYAGYTQTSQIPQFQLLVKGNIYINNQVGTLHGFYTAEQAGATGGTIYTCATAIRRPVVGSSLATDYDTCNHPLAFYGGVAAKTLKLGRTFGNLEVGKTAAEQFVYTPELWLGNLGAPSSGTQPYQSVTSLPPIL